MLPLSVSVLVRHKATEFFLNVLIVTDYIDLYLIHDPFAGSERRIATYKALQEAKQAGKIRSVGVSNL